MQVLTDVGHQVTARQLMHIMLYDNGAVNRFEPDNLKRYPLTIFNRLTKACELFFDKYPQFLTEEDLDNIAAGGQEENEEKYGCYTEYLELDKILNEFFDLM